MRKFFAYKICKQGLLANFSTFPTNFCANLASRQFFELIFGLLRRFMGIFAERIKNSQANLAYKFAYKICKQNCKQNCKQTIFPWLIFLLTNFVSKFVSNFCLLFGTLFKG
jgi:hypothetical protein